MISINFAGRNYRFIEWVQNGLVVLNALLIVTATVIIGAAFSLRAEFAAVEKKVGEAEAAEAQVRPLLAERDRVVKDLNAMSGLIESRRFSWTRLLTNVEKSFPVGVALAKIDYNSRDYSLALEGSAESPESLRNLMIGLERTPAFSEPYLRHQSIDKGSISFNVVAFYREPKTAGVALGK